MQTFDDDDGITGINVTPLVDIMLVLLIVFMATTTYIVQQSIQVSLPKADSGNTTQGGTKNLSFVVDRNSNLFADGKPLQFAEIKDQIQAAQKSAKDETKSLQALISADKDTPHGTVIKLIDEVRKNGISDFAIRVEAQAGAAR